MSNILTALAQHPKSDGGGSAPIGVPTVRYALRSERTLTRARIKHRIGKWQRVRSRYYYCYYFYYYYYYYYYYSTRKAVLAPAAFLQAKSSSSSSRSFQPVNTNGKKRRGASTVVPRKGRN